MSNAHTQFQVNIYIRTYQSIVISNSNGKYFHRINEKDWRKQQQKQQQYMHALMNRTCGSSGDSQPKIRQKYEKGPTIRTTKSWNHTHRFSAHNRNSMYWPGNTFTVLSLFFGQTKNVVCCILSYEFLNRTHTFW